MSWLKLVNRTNDPNIDSAKNFVFLVIVIITIYTKLLYFGNKILIKFEVYISILIINLSSHKKILNY